MDPLSGRIGRLDARLVPRRRIDQRLGDDFRLIVAKRDRNHELPADEKTDRSDVFSVIEA